MDILTQFIWKFDQMTPKFCRTPTKANYEIEELIIKFYLIQENMPMSNEMKFYYLQQDYGLEGEYHLHFICTTGDSLTTVLTTIPVYMLIFANHDKYSKATSLFTDLIKLYNRMDKYMH